ncbi:MAG: bifunctional ornithine acetyltransferase/N-acetylglutamate synthase, partial [Lachnospiraceae bacterium]|nr:bifunctional ornithine acetyltransferase/N-acetylglutamate synthase [Lachnospiraceae bacterium]
MKKIEGGVTKAKGFTAASCAAGIKYKGREDMALVYSKKPCVAAATFTSNVVKAAPVLWDRKLIREDKRDIHAIVVNTGIANAGTGKEGLDCCERTADKAAALLGINKEEVVVGSTGVIGPQLNMEALLAGIEKMVPVLSDSKEAADKAAAAIMTTDTHPKQAAVELEISGEKVT